VSVKFLHLFPKQLGLNGEQGNLDCLVQRLTWAGQECHVEVFEGEGNIPSKIDAVFIGSGTLAGALEALELLGDQGPTIRQLASEGTPILALGLGWEILGESIKLLDQSSVVGAGVFPSRSQRVQQRASAESFGFDESGVLTTGYANHSSEIELLDQAAALIQLQVGFGNSSSQTARQRPDEGLLVGNLMAARLNGPLLPLNPHLADKFLSMVASRSNFDYNQNSSEARTADAFAAKARSELKERLAR
jgi:CobQ-like glutamine amidotransferase family enzyme